jgi:tetratricopeptide (TPR) repeat protein
MKVQTQRRMVQRLIPAIKLIAGDFEDFGGKLLDHMIQTPLDHSGVNFLGLPVSRVLDSVSDDGAVVAQYSAESDYFSAGMAKASGDIDKALKRRPNVKRILLISAEERRPIIADDFKKKVLQEDRMKGRSIGIFGAQSIAAWIVRRLLFNDAAVDELSEYLPELAQLRDEAVSDLLFPKLRSRHNFRPMVTAEISRRLEVNPCLILTGIGGCGKSEAATAFGWEDAKKYDLRIWLESDEFKGAAGLKALPLARGGAKRNIATLLKRQRCLLVIDDPAVAVVPIELADLCGPGSHVLVTGREVASGEYRLPDLSAEEAQAILHGSEEQVCPVRVFETIWGTVGGHPLTFSLMNAAVRDGATWEDLELDCQAVGQLADPKQRLADRLLGRYRAALKDELSIFEWAGQPECDHGFLRAAILPIGIRKLNERALTASDIPSSVRLHDVIFASLSSLDWWSAELRARWSDALEHYLTEMSKFNDLRFRAAAVSLRDRLRTFVEAGDKRPAFVLALLEVTSHEGSDLLALDDPVLQAAELSQGRRAIDPLLLRAIIETFEWQYLRTKQAGRDEATAFANRGLQLFDYLESIPHLTLRQRSEIRHHRGKALAWSGHRKEALKEFEAVLASVAPLDASRLQLMRGYKYAEENDKAIALGEEVINTAEAKPGVVSPSVLLAVMQDIPWREEVARNRILWPRQDFIVRTIVENAIGGLEQAYTTLAAVARFWSKEAPAVLDGVLQAIAKSDMDRFEDDGTRNGFADVMFEYGRSRGAQGGDALQLALDLFEGATKSSQFNLQRKAELLIVMGRASEAEIILKARNDLQTSGWIQRLLSHALTQQTRFKEALNWIDLALTDARCKSHLHEFWEHRYKIRVALGDRDAMEDLRKAHVLAPVGPIRNRLEMGLGLPEADADG